MFSASGSAPWQTGAPSHSHPAYIPVNTRNPYAPLQPPPTYVPPPHNQLHQNAAPPPPPAMAVAPAPAAAAEPRKKVEWPPAVRDYVNRCFDAENAIQGIDRPDIEKRLREVITNAAQNNMLNVINWERLPLPQQMIADDRNRAAFSALVPPPHFLPPPPHMLPRSFMPGVAPGAHEAPKKRKSSEFAADVDSSNQAQPPWRAKKGGALEDRMEKRQKVDTNQSPSKLNHELEQRRRRFEKDRPAGKGWNSPAAAPAEPTPPPGPVVGRCENLEKRYFRLTSAPNPDEVRPLRVLTKTLEHLKKKWRQDSNYDWAKDQFKSLRQDLTVQHIKNEFTTSVYEIHARIALEKGDLGEFNQCQSQLRNLYRQNLGGHPIEFKAYRILYTIYTNNKTDMTNVLSELTPADKKEPAIKHALAVRSALALGNYHQFFKLYLDPPNMGAYLMDMLIERERLSALAHMSRAYKPAVRLRLITEELAFESDEEAAQFVLDHGGKELLEEKDDYVRVLTGNRIFQDARDAAFATIDIKGQT